MEWTRQEATARSPLKFSLSKSVSLSENFVPKKWWLKTPDSSLLETGNFLFFTFQPTTPLSHNGAKGNARHLATIRIQQLKSAGKKAGNRRHLAVGRRRQRRPTEAKQDKTSFSLPQEDLRL